MKIEEVPMLVKPNFEEESDSGQCSNLASIMLEISKACYLEEILFGKKQSKERFEIESYIEQATRLDTDELLQKVNKALAMKMFLVGQNITAADIVVFLNLATHFKELLDF